MHPSISIVITSYNHKDYLQEAIESVINQTVKPFEILVADDGSTDGSVELIENYSKTHADWIIPVIHENMGISRNRNSALERVRGEFVGVLDGDDVFARTKIEKQSQALQNDPGLGVVYSNFSRFRDDGTILNQRYKEQQPSGDIFFHVANLNFGIMRTMIARTSAVREAGLMDPQLPKFDGLWLSIQLASRYRFGYIDEILVRKRWHPGGDSLKKPEQNFADLSEIHRRSMKLASGLSAKQKNLLNTNWNRHLQSLGDTRA